MSDQVEAIIQQNNKICELISSLQGSFNTLEPVQQEQALLEMDLHFQEIEKNKNDALQALEGLLPDEKDVYEGEIEDFEDAVEELKGKSISLKEEHQRAKEQAQESEKIILGFNEIPQENISTKSSSCNETHPANVIYSSLIDDREKLANIDAAIQCKKENLPREKPKKSKCVLLAIVILLLVVLIVILCLAFIPGAPIYCSRVDDPSNCGNSTSHSN